jgi:endonuclease/exonuclease/phosphatase family metal-dependent hydrolase
MKIVTYNIQYGLGRDGRYDLERIANTVDGADVIGLNEVDRFWPRDNGYPANQSIDQVKELSEFLPGYYWVYSPYFDVDASSKRADGAVTNRRRQQGCMLLSRTPIIYSRVHDFQKSNSVDNFSMRMGAIEGVIEFPSRPVRFYSLHLSSNSSEERLDQVQQLLRSCRRNQSEGAVWTGNPISASGIDWSNGEEQPPNPVDAIMIGDFNFLQDSPEYKELVKPAPGGSEYVEHCHALVDSWLAAGDGSDGDGATFSDASGLDASGERLDYCFVGSQLADRLISARVDRDVIGSDHQPLWVEIDL